MESCIHVIKVKCCGHMSERVSQSQFLDDLEIPMPSGDCFRVSVDEDVSIRVGLFKSLRPSEKTKGTIVLSHGYAEYMEKYAETVSDFLNLGYRVAMIEWRSHGCSGGRSDIRWDVLHFKDFDKNISDLNIVMRDFIMLRFPPPYFGVSHSMGGQINLRTAVLHKGLFHSLALSAPMIGLNEHPFQLSLERHGKRHAAEVLPCRWTRSSSWVLSSMARFRPLVVACFSCRGSPHNAPHYPNWRPSIFPGTA